MKRPKQASVVTFALSEVKPVIDPLETVLVEVEQFGLTNDASTSELPRGMFNITRDTGEFLAVLVRATMARRVLEIGTSNGYSTLWLASAARAIGGSVTTVEIAEYKIRLAAANFARCDLAPYISIIREDGGRVLERWADSAFDLIFLDSARSEYRSWWPNLKRVLRPGGLLVVDNATSHAEQLAPFVALVNADADFSTSLVPVGKGEFLAVRGVE
jgi:predicted O-methyltransferase YrrM